jgi:hypothetical protein
MSTQMIATHDLATEEELILYQGTGEQLYVWDEPVSSVSALSDGIVALSTETRTVHIGAADYWRVLHGDGGASAYTAGLLAARLAHIKQHATALIDTLAQQAQAAPAVYLASSAQIAALRTALGMPAAESGARERARS